MKTAPDTFPPTGIALPAGQVTVSYKGSDAVLGSTAKVSVNLR